MGALDVMKSVGNRWQNMTEKERQYFQDQADVDKIRYLKEMNEFYNEVEKIGDKAKTATKLLGSDEKSEEQSDQSKEVV